MGRRLVRVDAQPCAAGACRAGGRGPVAACPRRTRGRGPGAAGRVAGVEGRGRRYRMTPGGRGPGVVAASTVKKTQAEVEEQHQEADFKRKPRFSKIPNSYWDLESSINIISIRVAESDVPYPINIYGTVLVGDQVDYRCVYLFKRSRDNPQRITLADDTLTLTGPYRALAGEDHMFFEFNLKIKGEEAVDQDFSKGLIERSAVTSDMRLLTLSLESCLSQVKMEFINVPFALEASVEFNILNKKSYFHGRITAGDNKNGILLYDSKVADTCGGSVSLTRRVVAVPWGRDLVLHFLVPRAKRKSISLECDEEEWTSKLGTYELQVKIIWTGVLRKQRANVLKEIERALMLW